MRRRFVLLLAATLLSTGCARIGYSLQRNFTAQGRIDKKSDAAWRAFEAKSYGEAAELYAELREKRPENPYHALGEAQALAGLGRTDEAWSALDAALAAGLRDWWSLEKNEGLAPLRDDPRFVSAVERVRDNVRAWNLRVLEAKRPVEPSSAPPFESWQEVQASMREENERIRKLRYGRRDPTGQNELEALRLQQANFAKIGRYLVDHPEAPDREAAMLGAVTERVAIADPWDSYWTSDEAAAIREAADRFLATYPESTSRSTAELHKAVATMRGVLPPTGWEPGREEPYEPACGEAMPAFEALATKAPADVRGIEAEGFLAVCRWESEPRDAEGALATAETYFAHAAASQGAGAYFRLESDVRKVRLQAGELPPFEVKDLAGNTWSPESMKGRVTILQFWSPG
jgi:hypothetical protein